MVNQFNYPSTAIALRDKIGNLFEHGQGVCDGDATLAQVQQGAIVFGIANANGVMRR